MEKTWKKRISLAARIIQKKVHLLVHMVIAATVLVWLQVVLQSVLH